VLFAVLFLGVLVAPAFAAEKWFSTSTGSIELVSNAPQRPSLDTLGQAEQLRYAIGELIGNPALAFLPPLRLLILKQTDLPATLRQGRSRLTLPLGTGQPVVPAVFQALARQLLQTGTARLPPEFAEGLITFISTIEIHGAHVVWGAPPPTVQRTVSWARVHMLATQPAYYGKLRIILFNLRKGVALDPAFRNATGKNDAEFTAEAERYLKAAQFTTADAPSRTLNAQRDLKLATLNEEDGKLAIADLLDSHSEAAYRGMLANKSHMAEAYDGLGQLAMQHNNAPAALENFTQAVELESKDASLWLAYAKVETDRVKAGDAIAHALELDPENAEAHYLLGVRRNDPVQFEMATTFSPQNAVYWDALATAYLDQNRFADAARAWRAAEQNAPDDIMRERMHKAWTGMESKRLDFETAERRNAERSAQLKLDQLKSKSLAQLHAAETRVNNTAPAEGPAPVPWDEVMPVELKGTLKQVECLGPRTRVTIAAADGTTVKLMVKVRKGLVCASTPNRPIATEYLKRPDEKLGTAGEIGKLL
jgi:tetratricopeptide (TPR) repeat protein